MDISSNDDLLDAIANVDEFLNDEDDNVCDMETRPTHQIPITNNAAQTPPSTSAPATETVPFVDAAAAATCDDGDDDIVSIAWSKGTLAVAHFKLGSMEMSVADETYDLQPDYPLLHNLFRTTAMRHLIVCGPPSYLQQVAELCQLPSVSETDRTVDLFAYRMTRPQLVGSQFLHIYANEEKTLAANRRRILAIRLPDMQSAAGLLTEAECQRYVGNLLAMHQTLVVQAVGNLLHFLDANWKYLYLVPDCSSRVVITDLRTHRLRDAVLMDNSTALALQIFSPVEQHPAGLKMGAPANNRQLASTSSGSREGFSLYAALEQLCSSRCGQRELRALMLQPTQDVVELRQRHAAIAWCLERLLPRGQHEAAGSASVLAELRERLRAIANPAEIYLRLQQRGNRPADWRLLQRAAVNIYKISVLCAGEEALQPPSQSASDLIAQLASGAEQHVLKNMLCAIYKVMDIALSLRQGTFIVRDGFDAQLDDRRDQMQQIKQHLLELCQTEVAAFPDYVGQCVILYFDHYGFLLGVSVPDAKHAAFLATVRTTIRGHFQLMHQDASCMYFQTDKSKLFNENYGTLYLEIVAREKHIGERLLGFVYQSVRAVQQMARLCARLDCMLAMARLSAALGLVPAEVLAAPAKGVCIEGGRHMMLLLQEHQERKQQQPQQQQQQCAPNDTRLGDVGACPQRRMVVLHAANAAGKSVYLKQIGLIAYMAHIGCHVPARVARIGCLDGIYSRIYALECTHQGGSAFLNNLRQMSKALMESSARSLILVDEFGKGTNATEGRAILAACLEHLLERREAAPLTLVSTHYRDLGAAVMEGLSPAVRTAGWELVQKTFEMRRDAAGGLRSTFRLVDGVGPEVYAEQCGELAAEMAEIMGASGNGRKASNGNSMTAVTAGKLEVAISIIQAYLSAGPGGLTAADVRQMRSSLFPNTL